MRLVLREANVLMLTHDRGDRAAKGMHQEFHNRVTRSKGFKSVCSVRIACEGNVPQFCLR